MHEAPNNFPNLGSLVEDPQDQSLWNAPETPYAPGEAEVEDRLVDIPEDVPSERSDETSSTNEARSIVVYPDNLLPPSPIADTLQNGNNKNFLDAALFEDGPGRKTQQLPDGTHLKFRSWKEWAERLRHEGSINAEAELMRSKVMHEELTNYGIALAPTIAQVGQSPDGDKGYFMRSAPIEGVSIMDGAKDIPAEKLEGLYVSLAGYYLGKIESGGQYLNDLGSNSQFIYGHTPGSDINTIYLVDQEPAYLDVQGYPPISGAIKQLQFMIDAAEKRTGTTMNFARQAASKALAYAY